MMKKLLTVFIICISLVGCGEKVINLNQEKIIKSTKTEDILEEQKEIIDKSIIVEGRVYECIKEDNSYKITFMYNLDNKQQCTFVYSNDYYDKDSNLKIEGKIKNIAQEIDAINIETIK